MAHQAIILAGMQDTALEKLLARLDETGEEGIATREFIASRRVKVGLRKQPTGARWTPFGHIELNPSQMRNEQYALSLVVHEVRHLKQGILRALSVQGELEAWQAQFAYLRAQRGKYADSPDSEALIDDLMQLSPHDRADLQRARILMRKIAGEEYHINWLPLFPLGREMLFLVTGRK